MPSPRRPAGALMRMLATALLGALSVLTPAAAQKPTAAVNRFALFAGALDRMIINRVDYGLSSAGHFGNETENNTTVTGGFWPRGTPDGYMFASGVQVSGIIGGAKSVSNPWGGDTTGGMFWDPNGTRNHGIGLTDLHNSAAPAEAANWPLAARVPLGDAGEQLYAPSLRGRTSASDGDFWFLTWEGDPVDLTSRSHPLGIAAEVRVLGWNYPVGNEDLLYVVITYYNISSANPVDYAAYRPGLREKLLETGQRFQQLNNSRFGITLPAGGYTIAPFYSSFMFDPDIGAAGVNFASVNIPFAMGYAYDGTFSAPGGWSFEPRIFARPFFAGAGFVGMKYLRSPSGPPTIKLYSGLTGGGTFPTPNDVRRLFRYHEATPGPDLGTICNVGDPLVSRICFIQTSAASDVRQFQSVPGTTLAPGASTTVALAYIHAAPVAIAGYTQGTSVPPFDVLRSSNAAQLATGATRLDSIAGFDGYSDLNADGSVQPGEMRTVPRSLYAKAQLAQAVFDGKFLLPSAPDAPEFFLIPGDNKVTVVWKPSATEVNGDPYFELAKNATAIPAGGGAPAPNPLYDPNFRKFDVAGYRIYRGRNESPASLQLVAEYYYSGATFNDYDGWVPLGRDCAPESGVTATCPDVFDPAVPGVARTKKRSYRVSPYLAQVRRGDRVTTASGDVLILAADTGWTSLPPRLPDFYANGDVPFTYTDLTVKNTGGYFFSVTAFDYNSVQSGPAAQESARIVKRVVPLIPAGNFSNTVAVESGVFGRKGRLTDTVTPMVDPSAGRFSKRALPANGLTLTVPGFVHELFRGDGEASMTLDSIILGAQTDGVEQAATQHFTVSAPGGTTRIALPLATSLALLPAERTLAGSFDALAPDPSVVARYGGGAGYRLPANYAVRIPSALFTTQRARACANSISPLFGQTCFYNGPRWFIGDNETQAHPNAGNAGTFFTGITTTNFNNVGIPPAGVSVIHEPVSYNDRPGTWRRVEGALAPFVGAADYRLYWSGGWHIDSIVDLTHEVQVPFSTTIGASWGVLNANALSASQSFDQRPALSASDIGCVEPLKSLAVVQTEIPCGGTAARLTRDVVLADLVLDHAYAGNIADRTTPPSGRVGFILYLKGHLFLVAPNDLSGPLTGVQWTMRDYVNSIRGGNGAAGNAGPYEYASFYAVRPFTAVGASVKMKFASVNSLDPSTAASLDQIHTVPDPYYSNREFPEPPIRFIHVPAKATVRIYTSSGRLIRVLQQDSALFGGEVQWDLLTRDNKSVGNGVYFYHVTAENGMSRVGRMTIVRVVR